MWINWNGENWWDWGYILKEELTKLPNGLGMEYDKKGGMKNGI